MAKTVGLILMAGLLPTPSAVFAESAAGRPKPVFSCSVGTKMVEVMSVGGNLLYKFGPPLKPDMVVVGIPRSGNVLQHTEHYPHAGTTQLRFKNGPYSYVIYSYFLTGRESEEKSGLLVFKGMTKLASMRCKPTTDFDTSFDLDQLPEDPDDIEVPD